MKYYITKTVRGSFEETESKIRDSLMNNGFGVISEIDMQEKLKEKLGVDFKKYIILGACNPGFAYEAIQHEEHLGVLLPCNVVVMDKGNGEIAVSAIDALTMMQGIGNPKIEQIATRVNENLTKALESIE
jgi:uncharacterized protein (DUF302 family)